MSLKAVELIQRAPLTNIKERLRIYADELSEDVTAVFIVEYPKINVKNFGEGFSVSQAIGMLFMAAHELSEASKGK